MVEAAVTTAAEERARIEALVQTIVKTAADERARIETLGKAQPGSGQRSNGWSNPPPKRRPARGRSRARGSATRGEPPWTCCAPPTGNWRSISTRRRFGLYALPRFARGRWCRRPDSVRTLHSARWPTCGQREFDAVLADAAELEKVASERAQARPGCSPASPAVAGRGGPGASDFADAVERDAGARAAILQDDDITRGGGQPEEGRPVKRFIKAQGTQPTRPVHRSEEARPRR